MQFAPTRRVLLGALYASVACAVAGAGWAQAVPTRTVRTSTELEEAFRTAPDGSRLLLAPGHYTRAKLSNRRFARGLILTSTDPDSRAVFGHNLYLDAVDNVTITGVDFATAGFFEHRGRFDKVQLSLRNCRNIIVSDAVFTGYIPTAAEGMNPEAPNLERHFPLAGYSRDGGLYMVDCENIQAEALTMIDLRIAVSCNGCARVRLYGIEVARAREGINFVDTRDLTIHHCHFHGFRPWLAKASPHRDHPDMIQYWAGEKEIGVQDIDIRNCLFHQGAGDVWTQTIFGHLRSKPNQADKATGFTVIGNTIVNRHVWAIYFGEATQAVIAENVLLPSPDLPDAPEQLNTPTISLEGCQDVDVIRNTLLPYSGTRQLIRTHKGAIQDGRIRLQRDNLFLSTRPTSPDFWRKVSPDLTPPAAAYRQRHGWAIDR